jgi:hypothetical protein
VVAVAWNLDEQPSSHRVQGQERFGMRMQAVLWAALGLLLCAVVVGVVWAGQAQSVRRGPVSLEGQEAVLVSPTTIVVSVPSCNGQPVVDRLKEKAHQVAIRVVTTRVNAGVQNLCIDGVSVELGLPLGDRPLIDLHSRDVMPVVGWGGVMTAP